MTHSVIKMMMNQDKDLYNSMKLDDSHYHT